MALNLPAEDDEGGADDDDNVAIVDIQNSSELVMLERTVNKLALIASLHCEKAAVKSEAMREEDKGIVDMLNSDLEFQQMGSTENHTEAGEIKKIGIGTIGIKEEDI